MFRGFGSPASMLGVLSKLGAAPKIVQDAAAKSNQALGALVLVGKGGGGMVKVTFTGLRKCTAVEVSPSLMAGPPVVVSDLLRTAVNDGLEQVAAAEQEQHAATAQALLPEVLAVMAAMSGNGGKPTRGGPDDR